jgi:uncharacterized protein (DUF302 family)
MRSGLPSAACTISSGYETKALLAFPHLATVRSVSGAARGSAGDNGLGKAMFTRGAQIGCLTATALTLAAATPPVDPQRDRLMGDGIVEVHSDFGMNETIDRLKQDIADKGILFFAAIDQSRLAADAHIGLRPSTLLIFGNPALGAQFITSRQVAGLDWPVRLLVFQDENGVVWTAYTDFAWIAHRHDINDREAAFNKASDVIASITSSVQAK